MFDFMVRWQLLYGVWLETAMGDTARHRCRPWLGNWAKLRTAWVQVNCAPVAGLLQLGSGLFAWRGRIRRQVVWPDAERRWSVRLQMGCVNHQNIM